MPRVINIHLLPRKPYFTHGDILYIYIYMYIYMLPPPSRIRALTVCTLLRAIRMLFQPEPPNPKLAPTPKARDSIRHGIT